MGLASFNRMRRELAEKEAAQKKNVATKEPPNKKAEPKKSGE